MNVFEDVAAFVISPIQLFGIGFTNKRKNYTKDSYSVDEYLDDILIYGSKGFCHYRLSYIRLVSRYNYSHKTLAKHGHQFNPFTWDGFFCNSSCLE
jgi:hypothetical protein